jgi:hypothetical protein
VIVISAPLIFPIGHYLGSNYPADSLALDSHVLRVGWRLHRLELPEEFAVWALAHGLPEGSDMAPWTLAATEGAARASGVGNAGPILQDLLAQDLIIEVDPDTDEATEFAQICRLRALHSGTGRLPGPDGAAERWGIGWAGVNPLVNVDAFTYELWKWAPVCNSIWHICEILAKADGGDDPQTPRAMLSRTLPAIQVLVANGAAYLDEAREEWELEPALADQTPPS